MTKEFFDDHASSYVEKIEGSLAPFGKKHDFFVRSKVDLLLNEMSSIGGAATAKVLDVGCGIGLIHQFLKSKVGQLHGIDVSASSIEVARQKDPLLDYRIYDGDKLPYDDGTFDFAFAICVMHHVPPSAWPSFLLEMARVVRPGGVATIIEHNPLNPATQWVVRGCELDEGAVLLWPRRLSGLFHDAGFSKVHQYYTLFTPFEAPAFRRLDRILAPLPLGAQYVSSGFVPQSKP